MKHANHLLSVLLFMGITVFSFGQAPSKFNYQAVIRDANGLPQSNTPVTLVFRLYGNPNGSGSVLYQESFSANTNTNGVVNLQIGTSPQIGSLAGLNWGAGTFYADILLNGISIYGGNPLTQLVSVPYALYSESAAIADSIRGGGNSGSQTNDINVQYNSVPLSDPSINHAVLTVTGVVVFALTSTNYWYTLYRGTNTLQTFSGTVLATDTNSSNPTFYISSPPIGCTYSNVTYPNNGQIIGINTNHTSGVYYIPLNATGTATPPPLYSYNCQTGHWTVWPTQLLANYRYFPLSPNSNVVTGFNLQFPVTVSITR